MAPLCMAAAMLATSLAYREDLDMSWLLCSIVFVAFNKVSTAQYFVWYMGILPVVLPHLMPGWGCDTMGMLWCLDRHAAAVAKPGLQIGVLGAPAPILQANCLASCCETGVITPGASHTC